MPQRRPLSLALLLTICSVVLAAQAPEGTRLLRQPAISHELIAFVYGGDIWIVPITGGDARQLTSDAGEELFPRFSPDGRTVAFTGQYDGRRQVYVIPVTGGTPRQLTFYNEATGLPPRGGIDHRVLGWTPDGTQVLFNAHRTPWSERIARPHLVPAAGGMETPLPMPEGAGGWLSPDGRRYAYTPVMREFRTWKRYRGGRAQDVWIYDLVSHATERITDFEGTDNQPVWLGGTIYFTSDRDDTAKLNLWAYDVGTKALRQVTRHDRYDVLWPSGGAGGVVYEHGGHIYRYDPQSGESALVPIHVTSDRRQTVPSVRNVKSDVQSIEISPTGRRALLEARGEVFTVPAKEGEIRNLTGTPGIREISPEWSPDGRQVAYLSDRTGEYEVCVRPADGSGEERRVTTGGDTWRFAPSWSPDSRLLAFADKNQRLRVLDVPTGRLTEVDRAAFSELTTYRWSPDSRWLAYVKEDATTRLPAIWVYSLADRKTHQLTSGVTADTDPVFDPEGRYLYFLSNRDFRLTFSGYEFNYVYTDPTRVYVGLLAKDGPALFLPQSDEEPARPDDTLRPPTPSRAQPQQRVPPPSPPDPDAPPPDAPQPEPHGQTSAPPEKATVAPATGGPDAVKPGAIAVRIDVSGFEERVRAVPGAPADHRFLSATDRAVLYMVGQGPQARLVLYDVEDKRESTVLTGISQYVLSRDGKKVLFRIRDQYGIADVKADQKATEGLLGLEGLTARVDPPAEWSQLYTDAWRILRDWFYDPGMHGVDWKEVRGRYAELLPHVATRADLDYVLGEVAGELGAGHVYVQPPTGHDLARTEGGLLGADIRPDPSGAFRIGRIYRGENWHEGFRSPLTEPGVTVREGDYILAVDGVPTKGVDNFYRLLEAKANRVVTLLVNGSPSATGARAERVRPVTSEQNLRYLDWVERNREYVEKASQGRVGYLHLPNTATEGNRELFKNFYPQAARDALIVDVRYNGGGFIPDRMVELVSRPVLNYWARRGIEPAVTPGFAHEGPKVCLINGQSSSGGDAFPYYFRKLGLGPLIGTRTWGGLIGLSGNPPLADGGSVTPPTFRFLTTEGTWDVEGVGVAPDIEVVDDPGLVAQGRDPSLERGVQVLLDQLAKAPPRRVVVPQTN